MTTHFGRYELLEKLASGGMGEVWLARQRSAQGPGKRVVLKRVQQHLAAQPEIGAMFLDEARLSMGLGHPNIAQVFDAGEESGVAYLAMEFVHGVDLRAILDRLRERGERLPAGLAVRVAADVAAGLDYAHRATDELGEPLGLVHRDVSPHNVLVSFEGAVKVIDFGIARAAGNRSHTAPGLVKGKFGYLAPEQARSQPVDRRTDVFALGIVLYEALSGALLFQRESEISTIDAVLAGRIPPLAPDTPDVDEALQAIVLRALATDPAGRFDSAAAMRLALEEWLIAHRSPASSAHLAGWLQTLFSDRLEDPFVRATANATPALPLAHEIEQPEWQPSGPALSIDGRLEGLAPPQPRLDEPARPRDVAVEPLAAPPADEVLELDEEKLAHAEARSFMAESAGEKHYGEASRPKKRALPFIGALLVLFVVFAVAGYLFTRLDDAKVPLAALPKSVAELPAALAELPQGLSDAVQGTPQLLTIDSEPSGAVIWLGREELGTTPYIGQNDFPEGTYRLRLLKPGYRQAEVEFTAGREQKLTVRLQKR